jgi:hypothetical protein
MKIGFYSPSESQMRNQMFLDANTVSGAGDDLLLPFVILREVALQQGVQCATVDTLPLESFDAFVFCEMPEASNSILKAAKVSGKPCFVIICENHFLYRANRDFGRYQEFERVFTYNDDVVDGEKVLKLNYAFDLPKSISSSNEQKDKLAVMICSNHKRDIKHLVYAQRRETINWFQDNQPDSFDLYGLGWERGTLPFQTRPQVQRSLRRVGLLRFFPSKKYPSWCGKVARKRDVLGKYRFGFCYENTSEIPGYITEKIFDVMMAGTVPVYLGPENAGRHIPESCFVNRAEFPDHESLFSYLSEMPEEHYAEYREAIQAFISSELSYEFSIDCFVDHILKTLVR